MILSDSNATKTVKDEMTSAENFGRLTDEKIDILDASILADAMETTAEAYMGISFEQIMDLKDKNRQDAVAFNKDIIERWASHVPESEQAKVYRHYFICKILNLIKDFYRKEFNFNFDNNMRFFCRNYICYYSIQHTRVLTFKLEKW